jgi:chemotaxis protein methyltransferase CheR
VIKGFGKNGQELSVNEFKLFQDLVLNATGLYFSDGRRHQLAYGLDVRRAETGIPSYKEYYQYLKFQLAGQSQTRLLEIQKLIDELTVQETYFFRNGPQFQVLKSYVIPEIVKLRKKDRRSIRMWSAGCSTGQEPYSIAMILMQTLPEPETWDISLLATDISHQALDLARTGVYDKKSSESVPQEYLWKYFEKCEGGYAVRDRIKKLIKFDFHNLVTDSYSHISMVALDIIFCRNVTIYFTLDTTKKVIDRFHTKLSTPGYLFLGHSESLWKISDKFAPVEYPGAFVYFRDPGKGTVAPVPAPFTPIPKAARQGEPIPYSNIQWIPEVDAETKSVARKPMDSVLASAAEAMKHKDYEKALSLLKEISAGDPHYNQAQLMQTTILSNQGKDAEAIRMLEELIGRDALIEDAYCLLGTLYQRGGNPEKAAAMFNRALYVNPMNPIASFQIAENHLRSGHIAKARKAYENTLKALDEYADQQIIPMADDFTASLLSQICQRELDIIDQA